MFFLIQLLIVTLKKTKTIQNTTKIYGNLVSLKLEDEYFQYVHKKLIEHKKTIHNNRKKKDIN